MNQSGLQHNGFYVNWGNTWKLLKKSLKSNQELNNKNKRCIFGTSIYIKVTVGWNAKSSWNWQRREAEEWVPCLVKTHLEGIGVWRVVRKVGEEEENTSTFME